MALTVADTYKPRDKQFEYYSDFMSNFVPHPDNKQLVRLVNERAVTRSLMNLISTNKYERWYKPQLGSNIRNALFELMTPQTESILKNAIEETIANYEPRVNVQSTLITSYPDQNLYVITLTFTIMSNIDPVTITIPLSRIR